MDYNRAKVYDWIFPSCDNSNCGLLGIYVLQSKAMHEVLLDSNIVLCYLYSRRIITIVILINGDWFEGTLPACPGIQA